MFKNAIKFGGVTLDKTEVASMKTKTCENVYGQKEEIFFVDFKSGVKVAYRKSDNASVFSSQSLGSNKSHINNVTGLELIGSDYMDDVTINGGSVSGVDLRDDGHDDIVVKDAKVYKTNIHGLTQEDKLPPINGEIAVDKGDNTEIKNLSKTEFSKDGDMFQSGFKGVTWGIHRQEY